MPELTVTLPDEVSKLAQLRLVESGLSSVDEYVARLIKADVAIPMSAELEAELLKGKVGKGVDFREIDWEAKKQAIINRHRPVVSAWTGLKHGGNWPPYMITAADID